jgi:hypothetical protein
MLFSLINEGCDKEEDLGGTMQSIADGVLLLHVADQIIVKSSFVVIRPVTTGRDRLLKSR